MPSPGSRATSSGTQEGPTPESALAARREGAGILRVFALSRFVYRPCEARPVSVLPFEGMSDPAKRAARPLYRVPPDVEADIRAGLDDLAAGRTVDLTPEELAEWERTGELPASVEARARALGCNASPG